jgi:transglutaminase-like putative cysteine protease
VWAAPVPSSMLGVIGSRCLRMRIHISHLTSYCYETPAASVIQMLRLTPRNHDGQYVARWRIDVSTDCRLDQHEDAFGNIAHVFTADGPLNELAIAVEGEVETRDTQGIVRGAVEHFPPSLYLRETALTTADANIAALAAASRDAGRTSALDHLHRMLRRLHEDMLHDNAPRHTAIAAADAFARKRGIGQDFAHVFIAAARVWASLRAMSAAISAAKAAASKRAATPGRKPSCPNSAGWPSMPPTGSVPLRPM